MISIFTTFTNPESRNDPWKEAMNCYEDFAYEVIVSGKDWPYEFTWDYIGKTFQNGFNQANGDWALRMDIDYFFHENDFDKIKMSLQKFEDYPAVSFPQYQFFNSTRYQLKTRLCIALNKKKFPNIKLNGGGDLCLATLDGKLIKPQDVPSLNYPIYQYDSIFRTREIIEEDRARFARAWFRQFNTYEPRGGPENKEAYEAWYQDVKKKIKYHTHKIKISDHPKYISEKLSSLSIDQFGYNSFGLTDEVKPSFLNILKGKKEMYLGSYLINKKLH